MICITRVLSCVALTTVISGLFFSENIKALQVGSDATITTTSTASAEEFSVLQAGQQLSTLRATHNVDYAARLLFQSEKLNYYVTLMYGPEFLKIIRTPSITEAEAIYRGFVSQTEQLAQVDIDALRLQAGKSYTDHLVDLNEQRLQKLRADAEARHQQAQRVAALQQQQQQQAMTLSGDLRSTTQQLDAVQQRIRALEAEQTNPQLTLPDASPQADADASNTPQANRP